MQRTDEFIAQRTDLFIAQAHKNKNVQRIDLFVGIWREYRCN